MSACFRKSHLKSARVDPTEPSEDGEALRAGTGTERSQMATGTLVKRGYNCRGGDFVDVSGSEREEVQRERREDEDAERHT